MTDGVTLELAARCHRNYAETIWQHVRWLHGATREDRTYGTLIRCDFPSSVANVLFLLDPSTSTDVPLLEARAYFGRTRPWRVITSEAIAARIGPLASRLGLRTGSNEPGMLLDPVPPRGWTPTSLTIRTVQTPSDLAEFGVAWCDSFQIPRWTLPATLPRIPPDDLGRGAQNRFLVGVSGGRPVACSEVTVTEGVAGISSVGTVPDARGRGFGTSMTAAAIDVGRELGAKVAFLAATEMGLPVYQRIGFRRVIEYPCWQAPFGTLRALGALRTARRLVREARSNPSAAE